jgi:hypothetical protein
MDSFCGKSLGGFLSKLGCTCGNVIRDQTDFLRHKGHILKDYDLETAYNKIGEECQALILAIAQGNRDSWITRHYLPGFPRDLSDGDLFMSFVSNVLRKVQVDVYECEGCGRIWVQRPGTVNEFVPYSPDDGKLASVLRSVNDTREGDVA